MTSFPAALREILHDLADQMIPAGAGLPSANDVGISASLLDDVLTVRPDLIEPLTSALRALQPVPAGGPRLRALESDPTHMDTVALVLAGGYLMSPIVAAALQYPFQEAKIVRSDDVYKAVEEGLLDDVVSRGPIYRLPPDSPFS